MDKNAQFEHEVAVIEDKTWVLVAIDGGTDIDPNFSGEIDREPVLNKGRAYIQIPVSQG